MRNISLYLLLSVVALCFSLMSCNVKEPSGNVSDKGYSEKRTAMEADAAGRLAQARTFLAQGNTSSARDIIKKMRKDCYLAIDARKSSILLMDSIDIAESKSNLAKVDSLLRLCVDTVSKDDFDEACRKVQFYEQKLRHDSAKK